jgi:hypothetical protein
MLSWGLSVVQASSTTLNLSSISVIGDVSSVTVVLPPDPVRVVVVFVMALICYFYAVNTLII